MPKPMLTSVAYARVAMSGKRRNRGGPAAAAAMLMAVAACAPSAELREPPRVAAPAWQQPLDDELAGDAADMPISQALGDPGLRRLTAAAAQRNANVGAAAARVQRARAQLGVARAAMLPVVTASAGISRTQTDDRGGSVFEFSEGFGGLDISYELDLLGGARAGRRAAFARTMAAAFDLDAIRLVVEAEVSRAFVRHAVLAERIDLLDRNIGQARELERIIRVRRNAGEATRVDLGLQTMQVRALEAERLRLAEALVRTRNAMAVLAGAEAPGFAMPETALARLRVPRIAPGQPAELLVRRPDIRAAEARIAAAAGDVHLARAAFLPRIRLSAAALGEAASLGGPLGVTASIGADLLAPIFNRGRIRGDFRAAQASQAESVELYRGALLAALAEAEDALAAVQHSAAREALLEDIVAEAETTSRLARRQYLEGEIDLQRVLSAEELLVRASDARALARQERLEAAIDLYRALGGSPAG